jgi:hypothetical protein
VKEKSVNHIYDEEVVAGGTKARFAKLVAENSAAKVRLCLIASHVDFT